HMPRACGDPMGEIGASKRSTARLAVAQRVNAREVVLPQKAAAQADAGRDIGDCGLHHVWLLSACRGLGRSLDLTRLPQANSSLQLRPSRSTRATAAAGPHVPAK